MQFIFLPVFVKQLKELAKKFPSIKDDFAQLLALLEESPLPKQVQSWEKTVIRSGWLLPVIYFLSIYDKSEQATLSDKELKFFISYIQSNYR